MNPKRKALDRDITKRMVERYGFLKHPVTYQDYTPKDGGIVFGMGAFNGVTVEEVRLFENGFLISTGESTDYAEAAFSDLMALYEDAGAEYRPEFLTDTTYISQLVVRSAVDLGRLTSAVDSLLASTFPGKPTGFSTVGFFAGEKPDRDAIRIERLADEPPSSNTYWSQAPLKTAHHLQFLQDFERLI